MEIGIFDSEGEQVWADKRELKVAVSEEELKADRKKTASFHLAIEVKEGAGRLLDGKNRIELLIKNRTGGAFLKKVRDFNLRQ